jgi:hypothetical protein
MTFSDLTPGLPQVRAGNLRALAITRLVRSALLPDLPTFDESGLTGFEVESWAGFFAPAGTPNEIVTRLNREMRKIIDDPKVKAQIANIGFEAFSSTPEELGEFVKAQLVKSAKMIKDAGIEPEQPENQSIPARDASHSWAVIPKCCEPLRVRHASGKREPWLIPRSLSSAGRPRSSKRAASACSPIRPLIRPARIGSLTSR